MNKISVVYSSSDYYSQCTGISIISLLENNKLFDEIDIYILNSSISELNKSFLEEVVKKYSRKINFIDANPILEENVNTYNLVKSRGSYSTYARMMLNKWFSSLDKILVIDSDTLVVNSLYELWELEIENYVMAAVPEIVVYTKGSTYEDEYIVNHKPFYYNMGIILVNLKKWRGINADQIIIDTIKKYKRPFKIVDQSIINLALGELIFKLPLKYNYYSALHINSFTYCKKLFSFSNRIKKDEFVEARIKPVIIHFVGHPIDRPWFLKNGSRYKKIYKIFRDISPWANISLEKWPKSKNFVFYFYDNLTYLLMKLHLFTLVNYFRYKLGQRIKNLLILNR